MKRINELLTLYSGDDFQVRGIASAHLGDNGDGDGDGDSNDELMELKSANSIERCQLCRKVIPESHQ